MAITEEVTVCVRPDLALRIVVDALKVAKDTLELVPEWHVAEREDLNGRIEELTEATIRHLKVAR